MKPAVESVSSPSPQRPRARVRTRVAVTGLAVVALSMGIAALSGAGSAGAAVAAGPAAGNGIALSLAQGDTAAGAQIYADTCSRCHQADGSGLPGEVPPLAGNPKAADADHVENVVRNGLEGPIEVLGIAYNDAMRGFPDLSDDEVAAVVAFVATLAEPDTAAAEVVEIEPGDIEEGHDLFVGSRRLDNGGAACVGCHTAGSVGNLGGPGLGPDLTDVAATFGSEAALVSWLAEPASPVMEPVFDGHPLTENEIADLSVFLVDAPNAELATDPGDGLVLAGVAGVLILIGGMAVAWRGMRQTYAERLRSKR